MLTLRTGRQLTRPSLLSQMAELNPEIIKISQMWVQTSWAHLRTICLRESLQERNHLIVEVDTEWPMGWTILIFKTKLFTNYSRNKLKGKGERYLKYMGIQYY